LVEEERREKQSATQAITKSTGGSIRQLIVE
jgi:hypothetical protein